MIWSDFPQIASELERVQRVILSEVEAPGGRLSEGLVDLATRDSKLLRPAFTVLAYRIQSGGKTASEGAIRLAAAIEMLHMASLIHDDIVDEAATRRRKPALHVTYGSRAAVLMGDYLFARCFALIADHASPENAATLSKAIGHVVSSEIAETNDSERARYSLRRYLHRIVGKTAVLFALSFHFGAIEAYEHDHYGEAYMVEALRRVGYNVGVGFQIIDDLLDLFGNSSRTGKPDATDLAQGVLTLPVILAVNSAERSRMIRTLERISGRTSHHPLRKLLGARAISRVRDKVISSGGRAGAIAAAERYTQRAEREIARLPHSGDRTILRSVTDQLLSRAS